MTANCAADAHHHKRDDNGDDAERICIKGEGKAETGDAVHSDSTTAR
ncbi:MAG: hypothetical protein ABI808_00815 [Pseudonocardiales bacterium]